jgi:hypothetical protein
MLLLILVLLSGCCTTSPSPDPIYVEVSTPLVLTFPTFPDPIDKAGNVLVTETGGVVSMPVWYFTEIADFALDVSVESAVYAEWLKARDVPK